MKPKPGLGTALLALFANPGTHEKALEIMGRMPKMEQVSLVRSLLRYDHDGHGQFYFAGDTSEQYRAYLAYNSVYEKYEPARSYADSWCCGRPRFDVLLAVVRQELARYGLEREWETGFMLYYGWRALRPYTTIFLPADLDMYLMELMTPQEREDYERRSKENGALALQFIREFRSWLDTVPPGDRWIENRKRQADYILSKNSFTIDVISGAADLVREY
ncbi:MAG: hypothetical protein AB1657_00580 [Candidatus Micrarchaeota archaeon]